MQVRFYVFNHKICFAGCESTLTNPFGYFTSNEPNGFGMCPPGVFDDRVCREFHSLPCILCCCAMLCGVYCCLPSFQPLRYGLLDGRVWVEMHRNVPVFRPKGSEHRNHRNVKGVRQTNFDARFSSPLFRIRGVPISFKVLWGARKRRCCAHGTRHLSLARGLSVDSW